MCCDCQQCREFKKDLAEVLNKHSMENGSDTPDFILAEFLHGCLMVFDKLMKRRERWYSNDAKPDGLSEVEPVKSQLMEGLPDWPKPVEDMTTKELIEEPTPILHDLMPSEEAAIEMDEKPHPMFCVQHGGSPACEKVNEKHGFICPRCDERNYAFARVVDELLCVGPCPKTGTFANINDFPVGGKLHVGSVKFYLGQSKAGILVAHSDQDGKISGSIHPCKISGSVNEAGEYDLTIQNIQVTDSIYVTYDYSYRK